MYPHEDEIDLALAEKRMREWDGTTFSRDELMSQLGISQADIDKVSPVEIETEAENKG